MYKRSPWGKVHIERVLFTGIVAVTTSTHGGVHLDKKLNELIPPAFRRDSGWYEQDCEWAIVAYYFPQSVKCKREHVIQVLKDEYPDAYMEVTGEVLTDKDSFTLRERAFRETTKDKFVAYSASGSWARNVPNGMVGVHARKLSTGEEGAFLVPEKEYQSSVGFIVDPDRHATWIYDRPLNSIGC